MSVDLKKITPDDWSGIIETAAEAKIGETKRYNDYNIKIILRSNVISINLDGKILSLDKGNYSGRHICGANVPT